MCKQTLNGAIFTCLEHAFPSPTLQVLDNSPQAVSMGSDEHSLSLFDLRGNLLIPEGQSSRNGIL